MKTMKQTNHTAWRFFNNGQIGYVETISNGQQKGDRYSYTSSVEKAKYMTEEQAKAFCSYMKDCGTVGFWN